MKKAIIIGAGPAGLTAGLELLKNFPEEYEVLILEQANQVGGISKTINVNGNYMDLGGHRFFSKIPEINTWWKEMLPEENPDTNNKVFMTRNRLSRIFYKQKFFDYPVSAKPQTFINMGIKDTFKCGFGYAKSLIHKLPETSLENFYINKFGKPLYSMFFESYTEKLWGRHPSQISADWGAQRVKGLSISTVIKDMFSKSKNNKETSLIEQFEYPKFGPGQMWEEAAKKIISLGGTILTNHYVNKINIESDTITVSTNKDSFQCDYLFSSMPLKDLCNALNAPDEIINIANNLPYRDFVTLGLLVDKTNISLKDNWLYIQDDGVKLGRIQIFNNWSPYMVNSENIWLGLEYFCSEGDWFWNLSEDELKDFAANELIKIGIINSKTKILDYHEEKVAKAYPAYFDSYKDINKIINYLNKINHLYCIGRNGQHRYNNMDHSMLTAMKAVSCMTNNMNKDIIWNVNTEKEYHEKSS